ncbi:MAG: cytosine permease, partial [Actinobacteria bacterium]|nr:cytosine permease [Actinomycetota bacterium]
VGNVWFYALGALLVLAVGASPDVVGVGTRVAAVAGGSLLLLALLVGESDNAFADIYSSAVSVQNVAPASSQRWLILGVGAVGFLLALFLSVERYEVFLFLIGSVFVPLFGVFAAHYFVRRRARYREDELFERGGRFWYRRGVNWVALVPWAVGFVLYHWSVPTGPAGWVDAVRTVFERWLHLPFPLFGSALGASLPSFVAAFALSLVVLPGATRRSGEASAAGRPPGG